MKETTIYISRGNLLHNHKALTDLAGVPVWPVLKSNAYGHGLEEVCEILSDTNSQYFIVQNYLEAESIWQILPHQQVLMLGTEPFSKYADMKFTHLTPTVGSLELLTTIIQLNTPLSIHLKINTGMNRQGFDPVEIPQITTLLKKNPHITITGILTHFSNADGPNTAFITKQYTCFTSCLKQFEDAGITPRWIHAGNTAGLSKTPKGILTAARSGIGLYGLNPLEELDGMYETYERLKPVLSLHTYITHLRTIKPGEIVGYGNTFTALHEMRIATIPVGYYEGIPRLLSNVGMCSSLTDDPLPIVGRVSMNLIGLDATNKELQIGDEVIIYSNNKNFPNTVTTNAHLCNTINYELTTNLKPHITRIIV